MEGPGKRYFDDSMRGGNGITNRFLLVIGEDQEPSAREAAKQLCASFETIVEPRSARQPGITLVRPDGYIAYSAHNGDSLASLASVRSLLERQTRAARIASASRS